MNDPLWLQIRADFFRWLAREIVDYLPPERPKPVSVTLIREENMALFYALTLPPPGAPDVLVRQLTVIVDGTARDPVEATDGMELKFEQGEEVSITLVDVDDQGNASQPSPPLTFTATDTLPPPAPGELGVSLTREE